MFHFNRVIKKTFNHDLKKYFSNISFLMVEKIFRVAVGFFVSVWVAKYLGPDLFGLYSMALSIISILMVLTTLGLDGVVVKELVAQNNKNDTLGSAFGLKAITSITISITLYFIILVKDLDILGNLIFILSLGAIFRSFSVIDYYFQSEVLSKFIVYSNSISLGLSSIVKLYLINIGADVNAFAWVFVLEYSISALLYTSFYKRYKKDRWSFSFHTCKYLLGQSWPLILTGFVVSIYMKIDQVMLGVMINNFEVGQYSVAVRLSEIWYFFPVIVASSFFPAILNAKKDGSKMYIKMLDFLYIGLGWMSILVAVFITLSAEWLVPFIYGNEYYEAAPILKVHVWSAVFVFLGVVSSKWFIAESMQKYSFYRTLCGAVLNVLLNYIAIPIYGGLGAAFSTLVSQMIACYVFNFFSHKTRPVFYQQTKAIFFPLYYLYRRA